MNFGVKLRMLRALRNVNQVDLATQVKVHPSLIAKIETEVVMPGPDLEARIKEALGWPTDADEAFAILEGEMVKEGTA
jgi:transcriptional regulator with XRE-family HTH domain